ncbi:hypothetical protein NCAS_0A02520 [Naumovozyma castellii]|uniref:Uncharacterized protein n=1 Tax=Naumovozyma castellii TaxID=27288 RepID=G0V5S2_NAUCA|nr:hypothetical protein NCAS_0A02520 [Naumovozyma castellii CBS 4309]CCC66810.1 hypothetical protein NCAS_0A02520 [Naumovozyma castellii CBS 4309]
MTAVTEPPRETLDPNQAYRETQSHIYSLQETILDSTKKAKESKTESPNEGHSSPKQETTTPDIEPKQTTVNSLPILNLNEELHHGQAPSFLGSLEYNSHKVGNFNNSKTSSEVFQPPYVILSEEHFLSHMPRPFIPEFGIDKAYSLLKIHIRYEQLQNAYNNISAPRTTNNELWGCDIYTDDSDPILALRHCGFQIDPKLTQGKVRTPGNLQNTDNVHGGLPTEDGAVFDLDLTIILLQNLQYYPSTSRFGLSSRKWGSLPTESENCSPHDGLSFGIYEIAIVKRN